MGTMRTVKYLALLCALLSLVSVGGVFAVWTYATNAAEPQSGGVSMTISEFTWTPEEILPTDTPGSDYMNLLDQVLNAIKGGLNSSKDTLENAVRRHGIVHSSQNVTGGNLKHIFENVDNKDLEFVVEYVSDTRFNLYMFTDSDTVNGLVNSTKMQVYKTFLVYDGREWYGEETQLGYATLRYMPDSNIIGLTPSEWVRGYLPQ